MKNKYSKYLLLLLMIPLALFVACSDDEVSGADEEPSIILTTPRTNVGNINLSTGTGPNIHGWAVAPAGLATVNITAATGGGNKVLLNVNSFTAGNSEKNGTAFEFDVYPEYTADFQSITITVTDTKGRSTDLTPYEVGATGGEGGPSYEGFAGSLAANIRPEVSILPAVKGTVKSHWGLTSVTLLEVYDEEEEQVSEVKDFGETPNAYVVNTTPDYGKGFVDGMTAFKIVAVDGRGFTSSLVIPVTIIDAPDKPRVEFDAALVEADLTVSPAVRPSISGSVISIGGLKSIAFYIDAPGGDAIHGAEITSFDNEHEYIFDFDDIPYALGVKGFKVVAEDADGQIAEEVLPIKVTIDDPNLQVYNNVDLWGAGARMSTASITPRPTAFAFSNGTSYLYDNDALINDANIAKSVYFVATATSDGTENYDVFSPDDTGWLPNNFYKPTDGGPTWAYTNDVQLRILDVGELDFAEATSIDIGMLDLGETTKRARGIQNGSRTALFETEDGVRGLIYLVSAEENPENPGKHKSNKMTFNIKVLK